jgi:hypothetical protein
MQSVKLEEWDMQRASLIYRNVGGKKQRNRKFSFVGTIHPFDSKNGA